MSSLRGRFIVIEFHTCMLVSWFVLWCEGVSWEGSRLHRSSVRGWCSAGVPQQMWNSSACYYWRLRPCSLWLW